MFQECLAAHVHVDHSKPVFAFPVEEGQGAGHAVPLTGPGKPLGVRFEPVPISQCEDQPDWPIRLDKELLAEPIKPVVSRSDELVQIKAPRNVEKRTLAISGPQPSEIAFLERPVGDLALQGALKTRL